MEISLRHEGIGALLDFHPSFVWFLWYLAIIGPTLPLGRFAAARDPLRPLPLLAANLDRRGPIGELPAASGPPGLYGIFFASGWALFAADGLRKLLGLARRFLREPNPRLRYWADASYWIYLSHLPVMAVLGFIIFELPMPDALRFVLLVFVTLGLIFPAYGAFVRHSAIGRVLHGPRPQEPERRRRSRRQLAPPAAAAGRRA